MKNKNFNRDQFEIIARFFGILAEPTRLAILQELRDGAKSVGQLVECLEAKQANISKQLGILFANNLLLRQRIRNQVYYSIAEPEIFEICGLVCGKIHRDARQQADAFRMKSKG